MNKKKLAIICADYRQTPLVHKAREMGIETHCFAWDRDDSVCKEIADFFHPISILEKERILDVCREIKIDGVTSIVFDRAVSTVSYIAQGMGLIGNNYEDSLITTHKFLSRQVFEKHGIKSPRFAMAGDNVDLTGFKYPLIIKPVNCYSAVGVIKVDKKEDLQKAVQWSQERSNRNEIIIEEFITGLEATVDSISWNGKHYPLVIKERENIEGEKYPFKIAGHLPFELPFEIQEKILTETHKALDSINFMYGASNTQFRINEDGEVFVIEINPRMAGDFSYVLMKLHNGYDIVKGVIDVALGQFEEPVFTEKKYSGVYFCRENTEKIKHVIENKENDPNIVEAELYKKDKIDRDRIGYFIYQSEQKRRWEI